MGSESMAARVRTALLFRRTALLIERAMFRAADDEWALAVENELPRIDWEACRPVVDAWLRFGEAGRAMNAFDAIPSSCSGEPWYQELREAVEDAEEAQHLGESVYPSATPMRERWVMPSELAAHGPREWFPGRVSAVDANGIHVALGIPHPDASKRRLIVLTLACDEWQRYADHEPEAGRFIFVAALDGEGAPICIVPQGRDRRTADEIEAGKDLCVALDIDPGELADERLERLRKLWELRERR